jgi:AcrR family transcriptional regulator
VQVIDTPPAPSRPPIVQARARRTRDKIIGQAKRAFAERGFEATNLTEHILTPAGVSVGSFYHQFTNKREVLLEIFQHTIAERHERIREHIRNQQSDSYIDAYRSVLVALFDDVDLDNDVWRIQWREYESPDPEIRERALVGVDGWTAVARRILDPWYPEEHPAKDTVARMSVMMAMTVVRDYSRLDPSDRHDHRDALLEPVLTFLEAGTARLLG